MSANSQAQLFFEPIEKAIAEKNRNIDLFNLQLGANLFSEAHAPHQEAVYYLRSGKLRMYRLENATTNVIKAQALLGDISAFCHQPPSATLLAMEPCQIAVMGGEWFLSLLVDSVPKGRNQFYYLKSYIQSILLRMLHSEKTAGAEIENLHHMILNLNNTSKSNASPRENYLRYRQQLYFNFRLLIDQMTEQSLQFSLVEFSQFLLKGTATDLKEGYEWIKIFLNELHTLNPKQKIFEVRKEEKVIVLYHLSDLPILWPASQ